MTKPQSDNTPTPGIIVTIGIVDSFLNIGHAVAGQFAEEKPDPIIVAIANSDGIDAILINGAVLRGIGLIVIIGTLGKVVAIVTPLVAGVGRGFAFFSQAASNCVAAIVTIHISAVDECHRFSPHKR